MFTTMQLGFRNLRRRLSRTLMTIGALALGTFVLVTITGLNEGTYADMIRLGTSTWNGQLQVVHKDYHETPSMFETVDNPSELMARLADDEQVIASTARVETVGLFSADQRTAGASLTGVLPEREPQVSTLANSLSEGNFLASTSDPEALPIVLGDGLARRLRVDLGDEVVFMGQAADGSMAAELFELVGVLDSGVAELDSSTALIRLEDAQELFVLGDRVHRVVAKTESAYTVDSVANRIDVADPLVVSTWKELMPELHHGIEQDRSSGSIILIIILLMVMLGTVNTLMMSVFERTRELGVMKALGTSRGGIVSMILWEGAWLSFVGVALGVAIGALFTAYLGHVGIEMFDEPVEFGGMMITTIHPANTVLGTLTYPIIVAVSSVIGALWPAWRASNLDPVAALREL